MNKFALLALATKATKAINRLEWTADKYSLQDDYYFKNKHVGKTLWAENKAYDPEKPQNEHLPHLVLGTDVVSVLEPDTPFAARLDLSAAMVDRKLGVSLTNHPYIATPSPGEYMHIELDTKLMILLPEEMEKSESRGVLLGWRPTSSTAECVELRMVRNDEGETKIELVTIAKHSPEQVTDLPFDQWDLLLDRHRFDLHIHQGRVEVYVNGNRLHTGPIPEYSVGEGHVYAFGSHSDDQTFNITEIHGLRIERLEES